MKKFINISLWIIIFLLISFICILSIKKFFDIKKVEKLDNLLAINFTQDFNSFNKIELIIEENKEETADKEEINVVIKEENKNVKSEEQNVEIKVEQSKEEVVKNDEVLFDNLNEDDLIIKLEKHLKNELSGTGKKFVEFYKLHGLDPYLAASIVLHETGCTWKCSSLVRECYNYGGMKGGKSKYKDTNYSCYSSKEEGINAYLNMLYNNYYAKGLTNPELINPKYAASLEWAAAINRYIDKFKNS